MGLGSVRGWGLGSGSGLGLGLGLAVAVLIERHVLQPLLVRVSGWHRVEITVTVTVRSGKGLARARML